MKVDMSAAAVTARLKRACDLGDIELRATTIRYLMAEIKSEQAFGGTPEKKKSQACAHSFLTISL
jgi:hypothetical protein